MRYILVLLAVLMSTEGAMGARWEKAQVPVWDFTPEEWRPYVRATVEDFNANMPPEVPRLSYIPMGQLPCEALPTYGKKGGISVCAGNDAEAETPTIMIGDRITRSKVVLLTFDDLLSPGLLACHEFTHAVFDAPDDYSLPHLDESCVQGTLDHLGPWDIAYAEQVYAQPDGHRHKSKHR